MIVAQSQRRGRQRCDETASTTRSTNLETSSPYQPLQGVILICILVHVYLLHLLVILFLILVLFHILFLIPIHLLILIFFPRRQRLSQLQLMALILVYVRKTNYFEKCESTEDGDVATYNAIKFSMKAASIWKILNADGTFPNFPIFHLPDCSCAGLPLGERPNHIEQRSAECVVASIQRSTNHNVATIAT